MVTLFSALTLLTALIFIVMNQQELELYKSIADGSMVPARPEENPQTNACDPAGKRHGRQNSFPMEITINTVHSRALTSGLWCCLFFAATMTGHFLAGAWPQVIVAGLSLIASSAYSHHLNLLKQEALIAIETHRKMLNNKAGR